MILNYHCFAVQDNIQNVSYDFGNRSAIKFPTKRCKRFSLEPEGLLYPAVHVALHIKPRRLKPADGVLVPLQSLLSLQVLVPGIYVLQPVREF